MLKVSTSFFLIPAIFSQSTTAGYCCQKITVSDVASELNGVYIFKRIGLETLESVHYIRLESISVSPKEWAKNDLCPLSNLPILSDTCQLKYFRSELD